MNRAIRRMCLTVLALLVALFAHVGGIASAQSMQPAQADDHLIWTYDGGIENYRDAEFVPGQILVGYHRDRVAAAGLQSQFGMEAIETLGLRGLDGQTGDAGVSGYVMSVPVGSEWDTIEQLLGDSTVAFATPNWVVRAAGQRTLQQDGQASIETAFEVDDTFYAEKQWYQQRINASRAWQLALEHQGAKGLRIRVAIIDSGVYMEHTELNSHLLPGINYVKSGQPPIDDYGHGTHVAGIIGATLNNSGGIAGVAPWIEIDPYKILDSDGFGNMADLAQAIQDATDNNAKIINLSVEAGFTTPVLNAAVSYAAVSNVLLIGSAGNGGMTSPVAYPAALADVVAVAATTYDDSRASYSAKGPEVEIAAPGGEQTSRQTQIFSTWSRHPEATCSTGLIVETNQPYCNAAGTSMAGAVVSGVAALIWGLDPSMPSEAVRATLRKTAAPLPYSAEEVGSGRVDAHAAVRSLIPSELQPSVESLSLHSSVESQPFKATIALTNPSLTPVDWRAELVADAPWISLAGLNPSVEVGTIRYGEPAYVSMVIVPSQLSGGFGMNTLMLSGDVETGPTVNPLPISLDVYEYFMRFPQILSPVGEGSYAPAAPFLFEWEMPASPKDRQKFAMGNGGSVEVELPFNFPMGEEEYRYVRVHSDGLVTLPSDDIVPLPSSGCLPSVDWPQNAIFGWWANLDPSQTGAQISAFNVGTDRTVIEYLDVPSAAANVPAYSVTFQIVLASDGEIRLNYRNAPQTYDLPPRATVGVEAVDGRFHNRIFCNDDETTLGQTPHPGQTLLIRPEDIY